MVLKKSTLLQERIWELRKIARRNGENTIAKMLPADVSNLLGIKHMRYTGKGGSSGNVSAPLALIGAGYRDLGKPLPITVDIIDHERYWETIKRKRIIWKE